MCLPFRVPSSHHLLHSFVRLPLSTAPRSVDGQAFVLSCICNSTIIISQVFSVSYRAHLSLYKLKVLGIENEFRTVLARLMSRGRAAFLGSEGCVKRRGGTDLSLSLSFCNSRQRR